MFSRLHWFLDEENLIGNQGLRNYGNTCYINACIQALSHIVPFRSFFLNFYTRSIRIKSETTIDQLLYRLISAISAVDPDTNEFMPADWALVPFLNHIKHISSQFKDGYQCDSMEFLQWLLHELHVSLGIPVDSKPTEYFLDDYFNDHKVKEQISKFIDFSRPFESEYEYEQFLKKTIDSLEELHLKYVEDTRKDKPKKLKTANMDNFEKIKTFFPYNHPEDLSKFSISKCKSIITDLFGGELKNTILCRSCHKTTNKIEKFLNLSLPLLDQTRSPRNIGHSTNQVSTNLTNSGQVSVLNNALYLLTSSINYYISYFYSMYQWFKSKIETKKIDLNSCMRNYFNQELLNKYHCESCSKTAVGLKTVTINRCPRYLIIHLNRYRSIGDMINKINAKLTFPLYDLSLKDFIQDENPWKNFSSYDLVSVICHNGTEVTNGHYVCYAYDKETCNWLLYNDLEKKHIDSAQIPHLASTAYILFYERNDNEELLSQIYTRICDLEKIWIDDFQYNLRRLGLESNLNLYHFISHEKYKYCSLPGDSFVNTTAINLSRYWIQINLNSLQYPGMISNEELICKHSKLKPSEFLFFNDRIRPVIRPVGYLLRLLYGGGPFLDITENNICQDCLIDLKFLDFAREFEFEQFSQIREVNAFRKNPLNKVKVSVIIVGENYGSYPEDVYYFVMSETWFLKWISFIDLKFAPYATTLRQQLESQLQLVNKRRQENLEKHNSLSLQPLEITDSNCLFPPLNCLLPSIKSSLERYNSKIPLVDMIDQIDLNLNTIKRPEAIDNWLLFGIKDKVLSANYKSLKSNKKNDDDLEQKKTSSNNSNDNLSIFFEMLSGKTLTNEDYKFNFVFDYKHQLDEAYNSYMVGNYLSVMPSVWKFFEENYQGGPLITVNNEDKNTINVYISKTDVDNFMKINFKNLNNRGSDSDSDI